MQALRTPILVLLAVGLGLVAWLLFVPTLRGGGDGAEVERLLARAERDWETGHYVEALEAAEAVLAAEDEDRYVREVARLTGEIFHTGELTDDGRLPAISPTGRYAGYATRGDDAVTRIVDRDDGHRVVVELEGAHQPVFSASERTAAWVDDGDVTLVALPEGTPRAPLATEQPFRDVVFDGEDNLYAIVGADGRGDIFRYGRTDDGFGPPERVTGSERETSDLVPVPQHGKVVYTSGDSVWVHDLREGSATGYPAEDRAVSRDGSSLVFSREDEGRTAFYARDLAGSGAAGAEPRRVFETEERVSELAVSPAGERFAFRRMMPENNWEIFVVELANGALRRVSNEPQHDWAPHFLSESTLFALKGERRNRRIFHYDLETGEAVELFLNNTVRTVEPQTEWIPSTDGTAIIVRADRDGNTVSPELGVYVIDLTRPVTHAETLARVRSQLASERDLRARGESMFAPIEEEVRAVTSEVSRDRMSEYVTGLVEVGPRHITEPANAAAADWVADLFDSFGFEPQRHAFRAEGLDLENVFVTVPGTTNPDLIYVVAAHFDAVRGAPGADDDATGMAVVFEAARVLRENPQPATIVFMGFNGEEAGLYGARAWVSDQAAEGTNVMGLVNHEVLGWTRDHRLDNTIRHNNDDLRDATHAAAFRFSEMITYDSYYTRSTDAAVFHGEYGEIVTALAGFPLLGNPHYHQRTDAVRTISMQLLAESAKTTTATVMLMASSPAPVEGLEVLARDGSRAEIGWAPSPENDVVSYTVTWGPTDDPDANSITVDAPRAALEDVPAGTRVRVRANNAAGMHGWGWARLTLE